MAFEIPPWIRPADTATEYARGMSLGVQIAQQTQRIQAQQEAAAMEAALKMQQIERESEFERQRIAVQDAYNQERLNLERQQLDQVGAVNQMKIAEMAKQFAAQEQYRQRVAGGEDPAKVGLELFPLLGMGAGDFGAAMRSQRSPATGPVQGQPVLGPGGEAIPGMIATPGASGGQVVHNVPGYRPEGISPGEKDAMRTILEKRKQAILDDMPLHQPKSGPAFEKWNQDLEAVRKIDEQINGLYPWLTNMTATATAPAVRRIGRDASGRLVPQ